MRNTCRPPSIPHVLPVALAAALCATAAGAQAPAAPAAPASAASTAAAIPPGDLTPPAAATTPRPPAPPAAALPRVDITGRHYDNAVGTSDAASQGSVRAELLRSRPALRPGEVLEFVPGLVVTQHSGDGKANQYFLRGFNLDHGIDFATTIDGMPVNMPTNGHGQGYTDLNFLMPELVERIDYRKGPYFATHGDFAAAGAADIRTRRRFDAPFGVLTLGQRGHQRVVTGGSGALGEDVTLLGALELMHNDGPWTVPEHLRKTNAVLTLSGGNRLEGWSGSLMAYEARWDSTDQVPQRLLDAGQFEGRPFGRFDAVDPSDGGSTRRHSLSAEWHREDGAGRTQASAWLIGYQLALYSNFTYAMERPAQGDQFSQRDRRTVGGATLRHAVDHRVGDATARSEWGLQWRQDRIRVGLFDTVARAVTGTTRDDRVDQSLLGAWAQTSVRWSPWLRSVLGLRADRADFKVRSLTTADNSGRASDQLLSPKLSLVLGPWARTELFVNAGRGFHSNDARGTTARVDPRTGDPVDRVPGLVPGRGVELGARSEWIPGLQSSLALWTLDMDSELVYVGDAGATEANRPSTRRGVEWNNRYLPSPRWLIDADFAWTRARFADADPAGDRIPNAVDRVASVAVTARELGPWSASLQWRYLGSGALIEDNSVRATPSLTTNLRLARRVGAAAELTLDVFNLFDRQVNDIQYFYESQLPGESAPVADRHVHPAEPRTLRVSLRLAL